MAIETTAGARVEHGGRVLRPVSWALALRLPGGAGGLVWSRPLGIVVREGSSRRFVRIPDRTRQIQWLILAAGLAAGLLARRLRRRKRRRQGTIFRR